MIKTKLIVLCLFLAFLFVFYFVSVYIAYNKGYDKKSLEIIKEASEIVVGSHTDILVASEKVKEKEKGIKYDEVCRSVLDFDLRECL